MSEVDEALNEALNGLREVVEQGLKLHYDKLNELSSKMDRRWSLIVEELASSRKVAGSFNEDYREFAATMKQISTQLGDLALKLEDLATRKKELQAKEERVLNDLLDELGLK